MKVPTGLKSGSPIWIWPFELTEQIGEGGMGVVYRARYVVNNREVAVKMLPADITDKTALARFEREMAVLKDMRHPNIVRCFGGACEDKRRFYAMELVEGGSLEEVLEQRGRLSWEHVVEFGLQMCAALECSHKHGVIHRDVKPGNFLIAANGKLKLSDFGLASVSANRRITHAGKTAGTFLYMAPEQIRGTEITPQTDLYALGCVLFELLTGRPPFVAETPGATLHLHCKQQAPRASEFALDVPATLDRLVVQLMEKDPAKRPESAAAAARALRGVTQTVTLIPGRKNVGYPATAGSRPVTVPERSQLPTESLTAPDIAAGPASRWLVGVLVLAIAAVIWFGNSLRQQRSTTAMWEELSISAMSDSDPAVQEAAVRALGEMGGRSERGMAAIVEGISSPDLALRLACVVALGETGAAAKPFQTILIPVVQRDPETAVRSAASRAMQQIDAADETHSSFNIVLISIILLGLGAGGYALYRFIRKERLEQNSMPGSASLSRSP